MKPEESECLNVDFGVNFISKRCRFYTLYLKLGTSKIRWLNKWVVGKGKKKKEKLAIESVWNICL